MQTCPAGQLIGPRTGNLTGDLALLRCASGGPAYGAGAGTVIYRVSADAKGARVVVEGRGQRQASTPTSAARPATIAVATPPDQSWATSVFGRVRPPVPLGTIGAVMSAHQPFAAHASAP